MAKIALTDLTTNYGSQTLHNNNNATIEDHLNNKVLYRNNPTGEPNTMENQLDMNSYRIINLAEGVNNSDAVTLRQAMTLQGLDELPDTSSITHTVGATAHNLATYLGGLVLEFDTMAEAIASTKVYEGAVLLIKDRANSIWDVVLSSGVTENTYNIVQCTGVSTLSFVLRLAPNIIYPRQWGAALDGVTNDTLVCRAIADYINASGGNYTVDFGENTKVLISYQGTSYASVFGYVVMDFLDSPNVTIRGDNCEVIVINHNITSYGGLRFLNFKACPNHVVDGFYFNMTFTGANTSGSYYPYCGAITTEDTTSGTNDAELVCSNLTYKNLRFKIYHEKGSYQISPNAYSGDNNNGFKIYSVFNYGDHTATTYETQNRGVTYENIVFEKGHNAYGIWTWAFNAVRHTKIRGLDYVSKHSAANGTVAGSGIPMIRYHQWYCSGLNINDIYFRAKPCSERTTVGFEGGGVFAHIVTNLTGDHSHGSIVIDDVECILGKGDSANSITDYGIFINVYGAFTIGTINFDSCTETTNAYTEEGIRYNAQYSGGSMGFGTLNIDTITFSRNCDYMQNIVIANGANTAAERRLKQLYINNFTSNGQLQYALLVYGFGTTYGVQDVNIAQLTVNGENNSVYNSSSTNSVAMLVNASESSDVFHVESLTVRSKNIIASGTAFSGSVGNFTINGLKAYNVTTYWSTVVPVVHMTGLNTPESAIPANIGSTYRRTNGGAGTCFYVKESGTSNTGWVAK